MNVVARDSCVEFTTKDSSKIRELMAPRNSQVECQSLAEATVHPGLATVAHFHPQTEEIYYIVSGEGLMAVEDEIRAVRPGDAIGILAGKRHQIRNAGNTNLVFLCCCVPAYSDADTVFCEDLF